MKLKYKKISINKIYLILTQIFLMSFVFLSHSYINSNYAHYSIDAFNLSVKVGFYSILLSIYLYYKKNKLIIEPFFMFLIFFIIFQYGQVFLYYLKVENINYIFDASWLSDPVVNVLSTQYSTISILSFILGAMLINERNTIINIKPKNDVPLFVLGKFLFYVTIIPTFYLSIKHLLISLQYGYSYLYQMSESNKILELMDYFFIPSSLMILSSRYKTRKLKTTTIITSIVYAFIQLLIGNRTIGIAVIVTFMILIFKNMDYSRKNISTILKSTTVLIILGILIPALASFRKLSEKNLELFKIAMRQSFENNFIFKILEELGHSMAPLNMIMKFMPSVIPFKKGESYFASIISIFPVSFDIFGIVEPFTYKARLDTWLGKQVTLNYGAGFSLIAESYYNFGKYGFFVLLIFGILMFKLLYLDIKKFKGSDFNLYFKLVLSFSLFTLPRRQTLYLINQLFYFVLTPYIIMYFIRNFNKKKILL